MPTNRPTRSGSSHPPINAASPRKRTPSVIATVAGHGHGTRKPASLVVVQESWDEEEGEEEEDQEDEEEAREKLEIRREKNRVKQRNLRQRRANHLNELEEANALLQNECVSLRHTVRAYQGRQGTLELWVRDLESILLEQNLGNRVEAIRRIRAPATEPIRVKQPARGRQTRSRVHPSVTASTDPHQSSLDPFSALVQVAQREGQSVPMTRSYANAIPDIDVHVDPAIVYPTPPEFWDHQVPDHRAQYPSAPYPKRVKRESYQPREHKDAFHPYAQPRGRITHPPPPFYPEPVDYYVPSASFRPSSVHGYPSHLSPVVPELQTTRPASAGASPSGSPRSNLRISALITPDQGSQASTPSVPAPPGAEAFVASPTSISAKNEAKSSPLTPIDEVVVPTLTVVRQHTPLHTPVTPLLPPLQSVLSSSMPRKDSKFDLESHRRFSASPLPPPHQNEHKQRSHSR